MKNENKVDEAIDKTIEVTKMAAKEVYESKKIRKGASTVLSISIGLGVIFFVLFIAGIMLGIVR